MTLEMKTASEIAGGYILIPVSGLCHVWSAYICKLIQLRDLRVWFACQEMKARRCVSPEGRPVRYGLGELHRLVGGVGGEHLRSSLKRLQSAGLITWSEKSIVFPGRLAVEWPEQAREQFAAMFNSVQNNRRLVPVPRRITRLIAGGCKRAVVATILGHLFRCVYSRKGALNSWGRCKATWIAEVFSVDERNVKSARKHLQALGWLTLHATPQWLMNRFGPAVSVNLNWGREGTGESKLPRPTAFSPSELPPPESNKNLPSKYKNQKPPFGGKPGFLKKNPGKPNLRNVVPEDLSSTARLLALYRQAVLLGVVLGNDHEKLQFVAVAEHARAIGARNPSGLFAYLVRRRLWHFATQDDEDQARSRLKHFENSREKGSVQQARGEKCNRVEGIGSTINRLLASFPVPSLRAA